MKPVKKERKYEDVYCSATNSLLTLQDVSYLYNNFIAEYSSKYRTTLLCPECRKAPMVYVCADSPYFKAQSQDAHDKDCSFLQDLIFVEKIDEYVKSTATENQIGRQMDRLITMLLSNKSTSSTTESAEKLAVNISQPANSSPSRNISKLLPRKRFDAPFNDDDFGVFKVYYGIALTIWEYVGNRNWRILFRHPEKKYLMCKLNVNAEVYDEIYYKYKYKSRTEHICAVAFVANFKEPTSIKYQATELLSGSFLHLEEKDYSNSKP